MIAAAGADPAQPLRVYSVLHDNRGGVGWTVRTVTVR
jgi:hypothetical protein